MIKQLISDLIDENITLSKALNKTKVIAKIIDSTILSSWLSRELEGYSSSDKDLPRYRFIPCTYYLVAEMPYVGNHKFPVTFENEEDYIKEDRIENVFKYHRVAQPISIIEQNLVQLTSDIGEIPLQSEMVAILAKPYMQSINEQNGILRRGYLQVHKISFEYILQLTKQRLLDTLLELNQQFPNLENDFTVNNENNRKVQNIVTNNIFGNNSPVNVAAGINVVQKDISIVISEDHQQQLKDLGVDEDKIQELDNIVSENKNDKQTLKSKAIKWLGSVLASVAAKGLSENIPVITEFVHQYWIK